MAHLKLVLTLLLLITLSIAVTLRLLQILAPRRPPPKARPYPNPHLARTPGINTPYHRLKLLGTFNPQLANQYTYLLVVLGSGGHTAEMMALLENLDRDDGSGITQYTHRRYVVSEGDEVSVRRAKAFEEEFAGACERDATSRETRGVPGGMASRDPGTNNQRPNYGSWDVVVVPRARKIHQSLWTAPMSCLRCLVACLRLLSTPPPDPKGPGMWRMKATARARPRKMMPRYPNLILTNGPATATVMVLAATVLRFFDYRGANEANALRTIYVESFARVKKLSLSGRILLPLVDRFLVQWMELVTPGSRTEYVGICVW
ncbi:Alg14-domain-containing protein [Eremomyces bilateralis CBS 781.70]|uniref:UDP-N-acetylglucosamine transferase subunit ALG14 n=1 Tax=Eremomyces bilateralis CBS 781.70 TaxID=1392243 RepID=A0A6G1G968_9PEZI|nr:Alg14-domain-containing protein [Eremomyces bilateralis CBS 781.70]KAF1814532.1 Alg14-domain-containing protein [Eremomyces bilateralis CBS 781.70]